MKALYGLVLWCSGCAISVMAQGRVAPGPDGRAWISASNGKSFPIAPTQLGAPLQYLDGALVQLEGRLVRRAVEVETWHAVSGRLGFGAFTGYVMQTDTGYAIHDTTTGSVLVLTGPKADLAAVHVGQLVLVEGVIDGTMSVRALRVVPLYATGSP